MYKAFNFVWIQCKLNKLLRKQLEINKIKKFYISALIWFMAYIDVKNGNDIYSNYIYNIKKQLFFESFT